MGQLRPAVDGDLAIFGVQADDDVTGKFGGDIADEMRRADRLGADNDKVHAGVQIGLHGVLIADAAADLNLVCRDRLRRMAWMTSRVARDRRQTPHPNPPDAGG